jgi:hypothetical protein
VGKKITHLRDCLLLGIKPANAQIDFTENKMREFLQYGLSWFAAFGIDLIKGKAAIKNLPITVKEYSVLRKQNSESADRWPINFKSPNFFDRGESCGVTSGHYFLQDLLVARRIYERTPQKHVDVGSRIDGFVAHVAVFREIEVFDIRSINEKVPNVNFVQKDLTKPDERFADYCDSLSCLHALEHFGLGRYGDSLDVDGWIKGFEVLSDMLKRDGIMYLSVPIGHERIEFNGQRVFSIRRVHQLYSNKFDLVGFSYIDDDGDLHENIPDDLTNPDADLGLNYGCGIFELRKRSLGNERIFQERLD